MLEGLSIPRYVEANRDNALGADNQQERPVRRISVKCAGKFGARSARFVEGHDFSRAVKAAKISRALAPEVVLPLTGILRDYMPDSNRTVWLEKI